MLGYIYIYIIICRKANNWSPFLCHVLYFIEQFWRRSLRSVWSSNAARITANMDIKIRFPQEFPTQVFGLRYSVFGVNTTSLWTVQPMLEISAHFMQFKAQGNNCILYMKRRFVWCWHFGVSENKSETLWDVQMCCWKMMEKVKWRGNM